MVTHNGEPALLGTIRHYSRGFYVVDLIDPDPVHAHLDPMYLRGSQIDEGLPRADGTRVTMVYHSTGRGGLWHIVATEPVQFNISAEPPRGEVAPLTYQGDVVLDALTKCRDLLGYSTLEEVRQARETRWDPRDTDGHARHLEECSAADAVLHALASLPPRA